MQRPFHPARPPTRVALLSRMFIYTSAQGGLRHRSRCAGKQAVTSLDQTAPVPITTSGPPKSLGWSLGPSSSPSPVCCPGGRGSCGCSSRVSCNCLGCPSRVLKWRCCCRLGRLSAVRSSSSGLQPLKAQIRMMPAPKGFTKGITAARPPWCPAGGVPCSSAFEPRAKLCNRDVPPCRLDYSSTVPARS